MKEMKETNYILRKQVLRHSRLNIKLQISSQNIVAGSFAYKLRVSERKSGLNIRISVIGY